MSPRLFSLSFSAALLVLSSCQPQSVNSGEAEAEFLSQRLENSLPFATTESKFYVFSEPSETAGGEGNEDSRVGFVGSRAMGKEQEGWFSEFSGSFQLESGRLVGEDNRITIQINSLQTEHPRLTKFLLSEAFFDAEQHPTAEFEITGLEELKLKRSLGDMAQAGLLPTHLIEGNLSLAGKRHGIRIPALVTTTGEEEVLLQSRFTLNRINWGLNNPGQVGDDVINDLVLMKLEILAKTQ